MAGYSGTPLIKKLGIREGHTLLVVSEPAAYWTWLSPLPEKVTVLKKTTKPGLDVAHVFVTTLKQFESEFVKKRDLLKKEGMLWVSWPKKSSKVPTDLDENKIRDFGLAHGMVDVKVCAVDDVWSGLKFVFRLKDR